MCTNDITGLKTGAGCYAFFLNAQGRILADVNVYTFEDSFLLDTEPETGAKVREHLDQYIIADDVTLSDETDEWAVIAVEGPTSGPAADQLGITMPAARGVSSWESGFIANVSFTGAPAFRIFVPISEKAALSAKLTGASIPQATREAANVVRLEHGTPRYGEDISERFLVQETNQIHAISFNKGCYLGQEIVERVRSRAQIHRILRQISVHDKSAPQYGTKLTLDDKPAGEITSAAYSPALDAVAALGYVRVDLTQDKQDLLVSGLDGATATVV
jgi:aminomethyltransferase